MTSILSAITKLPRYIKIRSTNGDENIAIIDKEKPNGYKKQYWTKYYSKNRNWILQKKKQYNKLPEVKARSSEYHKNYHLIHKDELNRKHREYCKNRNNNK